jgi:hypothetical protein
MMLTELAGRVEISIAYLSHMPLDDLFAAARRQRGRRWRRHSKFR